MAHGDTNLSTLSDVILIKIVRRVYRIKDKKKFILAKKNSNNFEFYNEIDWLKCSASRVKVMFRFQYIS